MKKYAILPVLLLLTSIFYSCKKDAKNNITVSGKYRITAIADVSGNGTVGSANPVTGCGSTNDEYFSANGIFNELTGCGDAWSGSYSQVGDTLIVWSAVGKADQGVIKNFSSTGFQLDKYALHWGQNDVITFVKESGD